MNKLNSFAKQFVAIIKGDDAEAKAAKVWRQAESAFKVQIAALGGDFHHRRHGDQQLHQQRKNHAGLAQQHHGTTVG